MNCVLCEHVIFLYSLISVLLDNSPADYSSVCKEISQTFKTYGDATSTFHILGWGEKLRHD